MGTQSWSRVAFLASQFEAGPFELGSLKWCHWNHLTRHKKRAQTALCKYWKCLFSHKKDTKTDKSNDALHVNNNIFSEAILSDTHTWTIASFGVNQAQQPVPS